MAAKEVTGSYPREVYVGANIATVEVSKQKDRSTIPLDLV